MTRILIVDDDDLFRDFLAELARSEGYEVQEADDGDVALTMLRGAAPPPDLMVVDFNMKRMNGFELIRATRIMEQFSRLPILMVTGTTKDIKGAIEMEGVRHVPKWSATSDLVRYIRETVPPVKTAADEAVAPVPLALEQVASISSPPAPTGEAARTGDAARASVDQFERLMVMSQEIAGKRETPSAKAELTLDPDNSPQIVNLVNGLLEEAIRHRASDIHLEPQPNFLNVRFRIDGILHTKAKLPTALCDSIVARLKIMCGLNITERRLPQDGRFSLRPVGSPQVEFRLSTLPAQMGEKIVMRLLQAEKIRTRLTDVFLRPSDLEHVQSSLKASNGMILVTGPTGSGKTTTLYTMLDMLNLPTRNIITIEDPVESEVPGVTQVPVNPAIGYTFERVIRACLRQDPDVIMVGEIRDAETAEISMKAAMTGHLVLSTLHANTAPLAVYRLVTMGVKPFLIVSAIKLVIAQRLLRLLCPHCKVAAEPDPESLSQLAEAERTRLRQVYAPKGCARCEGLGYKGRRVVTEVMPFKSHAIRQLAYECANPDLILTQAKAEGMITISEGALKLAEEGLTSLSEAVSLHADD